MADARSRRTGEHNPLIVKLIADAAAMSERIDALEARIRHLEAERAKPTGGPPPLPKARGMPPRPTATSKQGGRRSIVDISEIAELVESIPPPAPGPPRPRK